MLILTLYPEQTVFLKDGRSGRVIGEITIAQVRGNKVRLGLEFPSHIQIDRHPEHSTHPRKEQEAGVRGPFTIMSTEDLPR